MKVQIVTPGRNNLTSNHSITVSPLSTPKSLDMFDINIISLQEPNIWKSKRDVSNRLDCSDDFSSIEKMISASTKAICIIALPQNYLHYWGLYSGSYSSSRHLKDEIGNLTSHLLYSLMPKTYIEKFDLLYENSTTCINGTDFNSAFCFITTEKALSRTVGANKPTTIQLERLILTTLDLCSPSATLDDFITGIGLNVQKEYIPQWLTEYSCFDDIHQQEIVDKSKHEIDELNEKIEQANAKLAENLKYKSILTTNGDSLVSTVFEILEKILICDLSNFVDEGKQDFLIKKDDVTFIGEIKGITSNVKSENVSQLDVHYQSYLDILKENDIVENVKALLIINPFRTKSIVERDNVNEDQIKLAIRNGSLIITTETFLKVFEKFQKNELTSEKIISVLSTKVGLLSISDFSESGETVDNSMYKI